jgi:hypothetical protein
MLITFTFAKDQGTHISQYLLPIGGLVHNLRPTIRYYLGKINLHRVLFLARAAKAFRERKNFELQLNHVELRELLYEKWLDPIGCAMAAYEFVRRAEYQKLKIVVKNMKRYFGDVPDTDALRILIGGKPRVDVKPRVPLFSDGLRAYPKHEKWLPFPANHLDFDSPWTAWRSVLGTQRN